MKLLSEDLKKRLQELIGINEAFGTGNTTDAEREEAFAKTNERVPYKKDLMIHAIKSGLEIGLLFKTNNAKDKMPISKYRTVLPMALGMHKSSGNEVLSAFHKVGQSESKARETGKRSAEAKDEWRLFKTKNILSMWLTGRMFQEAPEGFKGKTDERMSTVEAYFNPITAKRMQSKKSKEEKGKSTDREAMVNRGMTKPTPVKEPVSKPIKPVKTAQPEPKPTPTLPKMSPNKAIKQPDIKGKDKKVAPVKEPLKNTEPVVDKLDKGNKKLTTPTVKKVEPEKKPGLVKPIKPTGYKEKSKDMELNELRQLIRQTILENTYFHGTHGHKTIDAPIISDMIDILSQSPNVVKFDNRDKFMEFLKQQRYFSASYSHCYYTLEDYKASLKGDPRFRNGSQGISESDRGCVMLFETGHEPKAVWSEKDHVGYIIPAK